jgi:hypothetical protein
MKILNVMWLSLKDMFTWKIFILIFLPPVLSILLWGAFGIAFWKALVEFSNFFAEKFLYSQHLNDVLQTWFGISSSSVALGVAGIIAVLLLLPLIYLSSMILSSLIVMPTVVRTILPRYPGLKKKNEISIWATVKHSVICGVIYLALWMITLPFWPVPGMSLALPLILNGFLAYRLLVWDAIADLVSTGEMKQVLKRHRMDYLLLGVIIAAMIVVPISFLFLPAYSALCFAHMAMQDLQDIKSEVPSKIL